MNKILANWKTSSVGLLGIASGVLCLLGVPVPHMDPAGAMTAIVGGFGLIFAGDAANTPNPPKS